MAVAPGATAAQPDPPSNVTWQSAGDSYSSGEGVLLNEGACAEAPEAYGPAAAALLRDDRRWAFTNETFTACTGHLVEDVFHARDADKSSLWGWGIEQGGPERLDVITLSFGGNDIGFGNVLKGCLPAPLTWGDVYDLGLTGCDESKEELIARVDALLDPPERNCTTFRRDGGSMLCDIALEQRRGSIVDFYYDLVVDHLTARGRLYVVDYPRLTAPLNEWPGWVKISCQLLRRGDAEKLNAVADHLNAKLAEAVDRANQALGIERVVLVDRGRLFRTSQAELCGTGDDWLNGVSVDRGTGPRFETSFHPNAAGHRATAQYVANLVDGTFPRGIELSDTYLQSLSGCRDGTCVVSGRIPVDHPRWGPVLLVSFGPGGANFEPMCADHMLIAVDGTGEVVWDSGVSDGGCPWYRFAPAGTEEYGSTVANPVDPSGRIFFDWDPGRYNGVTALTVTEDGFDDHRTLPVETYSTRFYGAAAEDVDADGLYEIVVSFNNCFETCAGGSISDTVFAWSGEDFTPVPPTEPQFCGGLWIGRDDTTGEEDIVDDIYVLDVTCYEAYGLDGPTIVHDIALAHEPFSEVREFDAAGYHCTVTDEGFEEQLYGCQGNGRITFRRYGRY